MRLTTASSVHRMHCNVLYCLQRTLSKPATGPARIFFPPEDQSKCPVAPSLMRTPESARHETSREKCASTSPTFVAPYHTRVTRRPMAPNMVSSHFSTKSPARVLQSQAPGHLDIAVILSDPPVSAHGHRGYRMIPHSPTIPRFASPFCLENTSQKRRVSSPAPVTIMAPSGLILRYSTR